MNFRCPVIYTRHNFCVATVKTCKKKKIGGNLCCTLKHKYMFKETYVTLLDVLQLFSLICFWIWNNIPEIRPTFKKHSIWRIQYNIQNHTLSVIYTAVKKWIGKMELTTCKTITHYRILILSISSTPKKQGQKCHYVEELERGYKGMKYNSDSYSP